MCSQHLSYRLRWLISLKVPQKSRAEAAVGEKKEPKILEAGGGKKSSEESATPGIVEAGGGKKITKEVAQAEFEEEKSILEEE